MARTRYRVAAFGITGVKAREILDSRGNPTVEVKSRRQRLDEISLFLYSESMNLARFRDENASGHHFASQPQSSHPG